MKFSRRIPSDFSLNALSCQLEKAREDGSTLLDLTVSNPTQVGIAYPEAEIRMLFAETRSSLYDPHPRGWIEARKAISKELERDGEVDPEKIWISSSTSEAYAYLTKLLADADDEILVPSPSYPLFEHLFRLEAVVPITYPLNWEKGWRVDFKALVSRINSKTRAVIVVHPNNPTGSYLSHEEMDELVQIAEKHNLPIISDEVFFPFRFSPAEKPRSFLGQISKIPIFVLGGLSKRCGLPQAKLSWISLRSTKVDEETIASRLDFIADTYLSVGTTIQQILPKLFPMAHSMTSQILDRVRCNRDTLQSVLASQNQFIDVTGEGGWSGCIQLPDFIDEEEFALKLLKHKNILIHPGYYLDMPFSASVVVSLLPPPEIFRKGLEAILSL